MDIYTYCALFRKIFYQPHAFLLRPDKL